MRVLGRVSVSHDDRTLGRMCIPGVSDVAGHMKSPHPSPWAHLFRQVVGCDCENAPANHRLCRCCMCLRGRVGSLQGRLFCGGMNIVGATQLFVAEILTSLRSSVR